MMIEKEKTLKKNIKDYVMIVIGSIIMALSLVLFLLPNKITAGGVSGIATILYHTLSIPAGFTMLVCNIPLFLMGIHYFGKKFGMKTFVGIIASSFFTDLFDKGLGWGALTDNKLLATVYGGFVLGIGLGIIMRGRGTTGGSDIVARIINKFSHITLGWSFMIIDTGIIILTGIVFKDVELILFCLISLAISSKMVDILVEGVISEKSIMIISDSWYKIAQRIMKEIHRGITGLDSHGMYTNTARKTLYTVVSRRQVEQIRRIVREEDPNAFVVISNVAILQGEGFRSRTILAEE
ncbi:MAG: YitT family protein [Candidatus Marinimicrobia bacterium]|nr:YitT family protein [Candidatus Neomarinimicrobiota bacterium]